MVLQLLVEVLAYYSINSLLDSLFVLICDFFHRDDGFLLFTFLVVLEIVICLRIRKQLFELFILLSQMELF